MTRKEKGGREGRSGRDLFCVDVDGRGAIVRERHRGRDVMALDVDEKADLSHAGVRVSVGVSVIVSVSLSVSE